MIIPVAAAARAAPDDAGVNVPRSEKLVRAALLAGVDDPRVLDAMRRVPRAAFVPHDQVRLAYHDVPVPIPHSQVTTQPSLSAQMIQALRLEAVEHVLEVGTGYGYQTALLARLASFVTSVERWPDLAEQARLNLAAQGIENVQVVDGDGTQGVPPAAPYDAILVSAAFPEVPEPLVEPAPDRRTAGAADRTRRRRAGGCVRAQRGGSRVGRGCVSRQVRPAVRTPWLRV